MNRGGEKKIKQMPEIYIQSVDDCFLLRCANFSKNFHRIIYSQLHTFIADVFFIRIII